jgi:hypothetical protein
LLSLKELAVYRNTTPEFVVKINVVIEKYSKSKAFIQRLQKAGFVVKFSI